MLHHKPGEYLIFDTSATIEGVFNLKASRVSDGWQWTCMFQVRNSCHEKVIAEANNVVTTQIFGDCQDYINADQQKRQEMKESVGDQSYEFRFKVTKGLADIFNYECIDAFCVAFMNEIEID